jgi:hypothetical protein
MLIIETILVILLYLIRNIILRKSIVCTYNYYTLLNSRPRVGDLN